MCVGDAQDAQDDAVRASASGRNFFFRDAHWTSPVTAIGQQLLWDQSRLQSFERMNLCQTYLFRGTLLWRKIRVFLEKSLSV